jgi:hypothetical protein
MALLRLPAAIFPNNAVMRAELAYQRRTTSLGGCAAILLGFLLYLSLLSALGVTLCAFLTAALQVNLLEPLKSVGFFPILMVAVTVIWHFVLMFRTLILAANSISREKQKQTWETLVLTGIDARQIVRGKWWATVQKQWPQYILLAILRVGGVIWFAYSQGVPFRYYQGAIVLLPGVLEIMLAGVFIALFTLMNLLFTAACGIIGSASARHSTAAVLRGVANRAALTLGPVVAFVFIAIRLQWPSSAFLEVALRSMVTLADNGVTFGIEMVALDYHYPDYADSASTSGFTVLAAVLSLGVYAALTWFSLRWAEHQAVRAMASKVVQNRARQ